nr:hypothetical protein [Tanacetum cinerariifolium]
MDSRITIGQKNTLVEYMILSGGDNHPPVLDKDLVAKDLWERIQLLMQVLVFKQGDDPIDAINKMMSFLSTIVTYHFPSTNNQLRNSSNPRQQATIHDGRVTIQPVQGDKLHLLLVYGKTVPKPKRKRDATWFRDKVLMVKAQGNGKVLNEEELEFLADLRVAEGPVTQTVITHNAAYQADNLDAYDSDCDDFSAAEAVLMANFSSYRSNVLSEFTDFKKEINYLKQTLSEQSKEKELLTKTFNVFKNESKEKEAKNIDKEIALEKKVKELDNIVCKINCTHAHETTDFVNYVEMCNKCLELEAELIKQHNMVEKDEYNRLLKHFSKLEQHCISLKLAMQLNKENFQKNNTSVNQTEPSFDQLFELNNLKAEFHTKDTTIEKLKANIKRFNKTSITNSVKKDIDEIEIINIELEHRVAKLIAENEHLK